MKNNDLLSACLVLYPFRSGLSKIKKILMVILVVFLPLTIVKAGNTKSSMEISQQQKKQISGKVIDTNGDPIPGVTIRIKGSTNGTATDVDGNYSLNDISENTILEFSFVGMRHKEIVVGSQTVLNMILEEETIGLEEVVAIGYGEQSRSRLTTSVSKLDNKTIENAALSNVGSALQGTIPGLRVINTTGQPGTTPSILLRGGASITSPGSPLVVVDGVIRTISDVNPNDIQSISVLKDAASTAVYGARANNGVILITTKTGKVGKTDITYTFKGGVNNQRKDYNMVSARDFIHYQRQGVKFTNDSRAQGGVAPINPDVQHGFGFNLPQIYDIAKINNTNRDKFTSLINEGWEWMLDPYTNFQDTIVFRDYSGVVADEAFNQNPATQEHNISLSGGNDKSKYFSSLNYYNEEGLSRNTMYERFSGRLTSSYKLRENFEVGAGLTYSNSNTNNYIANNNFYRGRFMRPTFKPYDEEGNPNSGVDQSYGNPAYYSDKFIRYNKISRINMHINAEWEIISALILKLHGSLYTTDNQIENFNKELRFQTGAVNSSRNADATIYKSYQQQHNLTLEYKKDIDKHNASILVGGEYYDTNSFDLSAAGRGAPTDDIYTLNAAVERTSINSSKSVYRMISGFSRLNYHYDNKYLLSAVLRYDGTSALDDNRWGAFPGVSAGWNVHLEDFFRSSQISKTITFLKPRVSYGINGNIAGIGNYEVQGVYAITTNYNNNSSYLNTGLINRGLRWEKSNSLDAGLELGFLSDKIYLNMNYFRRVTTDLLTNLALPDYTGFSSLRTNLGNLENKGFEAEMNVNILRQNNGINWDFGMNVSYVKNKILKLPYNGVENNRQGGERIYDPEKGLIWVGGYQEGKSIGDIVAYNAERILKDWEDVNNTVPNRYDAVAELYGPKLYSTLTNKKGRYPIEPGDVVWSDFDKNDTIDHRDRYVVGNIYPKWTGGFNTSIGYKNFSLYTRFDYALGHIIYNDFAAKIMGNMIGSMNIIDWVKDSWTPENHDAKYPAYTYGDYPKLNIKRSGLHYDTPENHSSMFYEKGDYLALRELTLSYLLPQSIVTKIGVTSIQISFTGQNIAYFTREYTGWNPESGGSDNGRYPLPRTFIMGLQLSF